MASYRAPKKMVSFQRQFQKELDKALSRRVYNINKRFLDFTREIYAAGVIEWFRRTANSTNYKSLLQATSFHSLTPKSNKGSVIFRCKVSVNPVDYQNIKRRSIDKWTKTYNARLNTADYILDLQFNRGILGLPKDWSRPNYRLGVTDEPYENPFFHQGTPLREFLIGGIGEDGFCKTFALKRKVYMKFGFNLTGGDR